MHDFEDVNLKGLTGVLKPLNCKWKPHATAKERTVDILGGSGCNPEAIFSRRIEVKSTWGTREYISTYDLEYVTDKSGKKIHQIDNNPTVERLAEVCTGPTEAAAPPKKVKRKH